MNYLRKNTMNVLLFLLWLGLGLSVTTARADEARRYTTDLDFITTSDNDMGAPLFLILPSHDGVQ
jgi:hypothetical protein